MRGSRTASYKDSEDASPVPDTPGRAKPTTRKASQLAVQPRGEKTPRQGGPHVGKHLVFVLDSQGEPLTPTTPAKARKLLEGGVAEKVWSKFGTFGIGMLVETPRVALGVDHGTKFEGYSVVADCENSINVTLNLPDKKKILKKLEERRRMRG